MTYQALPSDQIAVPTTGKPACLLTWVDRPGGGIRLYASRVLHNQDWGQRTTETGPVHWHMATTMTNVLIKDADTPAEAIQWVLERWMREDEEAERLRTARRIQQHERIGLAVNDPKALIQGLPGI